MNPHITYCCIVLIMAPALYKFQVPNFSHSPKAYFCTVFVRALTTLYIHAKFQDFSFSHSTDMRGSQNVKLGRSVGGSGPTSNTIFQGFTGVFTPNSILICSDVFWHSEAEMSHVTDCHTREHR